MFQFPWMSCGCSFMGCWLLVSLPDPTLKNVWIWTISLLSMDPITT